MTHEPMKEYRRGDIWHADLGEPRPGSVQTGRRPVLIIQNDVGNHFSSTVIIAVISSKKKDPLPVHVFVSKEEAHLLYDSYIFLEQIRTLDKRHLEKYMTHLSSRKMAEVDEAIQVSMFAKPKTIFKGAI